MKIVSRSLFEARCLRGKLLTKSIIEIRCGENRGLFSEYICLAIMFASVVHSVLGTCAWADLDLCLLRSPCVVYRISFIALSAAYRDHRATSDSTYFGGYKWVWYATAVCFLLNNTLIPSPAWYWWALNTDTEAAEATRCLIVFSVVTMIICLPLTFSSMSSVGISRRLPCSSQ